MNNKLVVDFIVGTIQRAAFYHEDGQFEKEDQSIAAVEIFIEFLLENLHKP